MLTMWIWVVCFGVACDNETKQIVATPISVEGSVEPENKPAYLIVTEDSLVEAADELAAYRASTGYATTIVKVSELQSGDAVKAIHAELSQIIHPDHTNYLLLLGDAPADDSTSGKIPALACQNDLGQCYTDNGYGDLNGDGLPDVAIGRIPAKDVDQAVLYINKVKRFEQQPKVGMWNRRMVLFAGYGGFGEEIEVLLETLILQGLSEVDPSFDIVGLYNNPLSPFFYQPFEEKVIELFDEGNVFSMYIGHGTASESEGFNSSVLDELSCENRMPIAAFFACNNGKYAENRDSISEKILWKEDGPIASFAASGVTHPYANGVAPYELQRAVLGGRVDTLGEAIVLAKEQFFENQDELRETIEMVAVLSQMNTEEILQQHVNLYNLFGDPALDLMLEKQRIQLTRLDGASSLGFLSIEGSTGQLKEGTAWVTLEVPRDVLMADLQEIDPANPDWQVVQDNWETAVNTVIVGAQVPVIDGQFTVTLSFEPWLHRNHDFYVKAYAENADMDRFGYVRVP